MYLNNYYAKSIYLFNKKLEKLPLDKDKVPTIIKDIRNIDLILNYLNEPEIGSRTLVEVGELMSFDHFCDIQRNKNHIEIIKSSHYNEQENLVDSIVRLKVPFKMIICHYPIQQDHSFIALKGSELQVGDLWDRHYEFQVEKKVVLMHPKCSIYSLDKKKKNELMKNLDDKIKLYKQ